MALTRPTAIGDCNDNGIPDLMVKFDMRAVQAILDVGQSVEITTIGEAGGIPFMGTDTIRVIGQSPESRISLAPLQGGKGQGRG